MAGRPGSRQTSARRAGGASNKPDSTPLHPALIQGGQKMFRPSRPEWPEPPRNPSGGAAQWPMTIYFIQQMYLENVRPASTR